MAMASLVVVAMLRAGVSMAMCGDDGGLTVATMSMVLVPPSCSTLRVMVMVVAMRLRRLIVVMLILSAMMAPTGVMRLPVG
eukprot:3211486-Pyramimonas_sp.AAC.1